MDEDIFYDSQLLLKAIERADRIHREVHGDYVTLERALFLSWWCDIGDCRFCYMSTQKPRLKDPIKARRKPWSILAEAELCSRIGWRIEFLSSGYGSYDAPEIKEIAEMVAFVTRRPVWLNIGALKKEELEVFGEEICGVIGSIETINEEIRSRVCPSKPIPRIIEMLDEAKDKGLKTGITIILGLGETIEDIPRLMDFISDFKLDRVTYYSLNPHTGTIFENSPSPASLYQAGVIALTRINFPKIEIIGGTWVDQLPNIGPMLLAGVNGLTKYPLFNIFGNKYGKKVEEEIKFANRKIIGTFSDIEVLMGNKKLNESSDLYRMLPVKAPKVSKSAVDKVNYFRERIEDMKENYIKGVLGKTSRKSTKVF
jgi:biotin synthase-like enzyme